ncbi:MAG: hypothetical protein C6Y22_10620 [Hapalosiphonaceae cyanobacterium JJU2]|nr:MAG: hypothetical protein C6Y22_10620 [Hapalosiphonaceae cyanobacterium JJU2]
MGILETLNLLNVNRDKSTTSKIESHLEKIIKWNLGDQPLITNVKTTTKTYNKNLDDVADMHEPLSVIERHDFKSLISELHSRINLLTTTSIPEISQFLQDVESNLFVEIDSYELYNCNKNRQKIKEYFDNIFSEKFHNFVSQFKEMQAILEKQLNLLLTTSQANTSTTISSTHQESQHQTQIISLEQALSPIVKGVSQEVYQFIPPILEAELASLKNDVEQIKQLLIKTPQDNSVVDDTAQNKSNLTKDYQTKLETINTISSEQIKTPTIEDCAKETSISGFDLSNIPHPHLEEYNKDPESLEKKYNPILLSLTAESIHQCRLGSSQPIFLEKNRRGNYWIIPEDNPATTGKYLVPKANFKLNEYSLETVQFLFQIYEENSHNYSKFVVIKPASLISVDQDKWQLEEPGILKLEVDSST